MTYIILGIVGLVVAYISFGGAIYYPTSYRAFIPKKIDNEYKEYRRLCDENIGKVVYAKVITQHERNKMEETDKEYLYGYNSKQISENIHEIRYTVYTDDINNIDRYDINSIAYQKIIGYYFYRNWTEYIIFTKGSNMDKKFFKYQINIKYKEIIEEVMQNQQNIGIKADIQIGGSRWWWHW